MTTDSDDDNWAFFVHKRIIGGGGNSQLPATLKMASITSKPAAIKAALSIREPCVRGLIRLQIKIEKATIIPIRRRKYKMCKSIVPL